MSDIEPVKSPYMNTWLEVGSDGGSGGILPGYWPSVFTTTTIFTVC
jgi:hypothetical protein